MFPFAVGPPPVNDGGGINWGAGGPMEPGGGADWGSGPEEQMAAMPPPQRSTLMALLGGIGNALGAPRRMMWSALGMPDSGAQLVANVNPFSDDASGGFNQFAGALAEGILDPITLGLGAGALGARALGAARSLGGAARLPGMLANDQRMIQMSNEARALRASMGGADELAGAAQLPGLRDAGTMMPRGPQSQLAQALDMPALPPPPRTVVSPQAIEEMQAASMAGYDPAMIQSLPGIKQMPMAGPGMMDAGLGTPGAMARQYKMVDPAVEGALTDYGWMSGVDRTGYPAWMDAAGPGAGRVGGTLNYGPGALPDFAKVSGGGIRPTGAFLPPEMPTDYAGMLLGNTPTTPLVGQLSPAQQRQVMLQRIASLAQGG